jgi:hypothetical protein
MMKVFLTIFIIFSLTLPLYAQAVDTAWVRRYDGLANLGDWSVAMIIDDSGNVYVTGQSYAGVTEVDFATIKYYPNGDTCWIRTYNGPGNLYDFVSDIAVDSHHNVYVTGEIDFNFDSNPEVDYGTIKYYPDGETAWVRRYNGPGNLNDSPCCLTVDDSGNVYVTGTAWSGWSYYDDYVTLKYNSDGDTVWVKTYNGPGNYQDEPSDLAVDRSGNVYMTGYSTGQDSSYDYATIKYYPNGDTAWVRRYNLSGTSEDKFTAIALDDSGNVYVTGSTSTLKYDTEGNQIWVAASQGGSDITTDDSGYTYITGKNGTIKFDQEGKQVWKKSDSYSLIALDRGGSVYVLGQPSVNLILTRYDIYGNMVWTRYYVTGNDNGSPSGLTVDHSGNVLVAGTNLGSGTSYDYVTIKYWQNFPPNSFSLISPTNNSFNPFSVVLDWANSVDPDYWDQVKYDLYLSTSSHFSPDSTVIFDSLLESQYLDTLGIGKYYWKVWVYDSRVGRWSNQTWSFFSAKRGDTNADSSITVADIVYLVNFLFRRDSTPYPTLLVADANCDGKVNIADVVYLVAYIFKSGQPPQC